MGIPHAGHAVRAARRTGATSDEIGKKVGDDARCEAGEKLSARRSVKGLARNPGAWVKSSHSEGGNSNCVEVRFAPGHPVQVRDSQHPESTRVSLPLEAWPPLVVAARTETP
ncbi:DUF397 domain-containing protein [Nocardiopsis sp. NPDC006139]|uniref:DUF397 domain-containing protein n=1 Tax=unclassified Nocardiopsis TaxID=2649073 RepID=UPI0033B1F8FD